MFIPIYAHVLIVLSSALGDSRVSLDTDPDIFARFLLLLLPLRGSFLPSISPLSDKSTAREL